MGLTSQPPPQIQPEVEKAATIVTAPQTSVPVNNIQGAKMSM